MCDEVVDITAANSGGRVRVDRTSRVCLRCLNANGMTSTSTLWGLPDGSIISETENLAPFVGEYANGVLVLLPGVLGNGSAGEYGPLSCTSIDLTPGYDVVGITLYSSILIPPVLTASSIERRVLEESGPAFLVCNNPNSPEVADAVQWFRVSDPGTILSMSEGTSSRLTFPNPILRASTGEYDCQMVSLITGETATARAQLIVEYPPEITSNAKIASIFPNTSLSLTCNYDAVPMPAVQWLLNGAFLDTSDPRILVSLTANSSELRIGHVTCEEGGLYSCTFENSRGSSTRNVTILSILKRAPDPPINVDAFAVGAHWIALRWTLTFDGCGQMLNFVLYISNANMDGGLMHVENLTASELMTSGNSFTYNVSGTNTVLPSIAYTFRVASCNEIGCSAQSQDSEPRLTSQDMILFQLRLVGVVNCNNWITDSPVLKAAEVIEAVVVELRERCLCDFEAFLISSAGFQCFPQSPTAVTFRAVMTGSPQVLAPELATLLGDWTSSGAFITIQAQLLSADGSCAVVVSSLGESECNPEVLGISTIVIGSVVPVAVLVILVLTVMLCLTVVFVKRRRDSFKLQTPTQPPAQLNETSDYSPDLEPHYERISAFVEAFDEAKLKQGSHTTGIELTVCPAYRALKSAAATDGKPGN